MTDTRLTIAAQILSGILAKPGATSSTEIAVDIALKHADELIRRVKENQHVQETESVLPKTTTLTPMPPVKQPKESNIRMSTECETIALKESK